MIMMIKLFTVSLIIGLCGADFVCPKNRITLNDGQTGVIPSGATAEVKFQKDARCTFTFDIPKGYAIRMEAQADYEPSPGDFVQFDKFYIQYGSVKQVEYAVGAQLNVSFYSATGNLTFFAKYSYVDLRSYTQVVKRTGDYFNLFMEDNKYYTAQGAVGDTVNWLLASRDTGVYDSTIHEVFMFDGADIFNAEYIGRLSDYRRAFNFQSDSNTLTFLNLYRNPSDTFVLTNDYSKVKDLEQYYVRVVDPKKETASTIYNERWGATDAYVTLICDGCAHFYIETLKFNAQSDANGYLEVQKMSPTQALPYSLKYKNSA